MKRLIRTLLINFISLWATTQLLPAFSYEGGVKTLLIGTLVFILIGFFVLPLIKLLLLPLNLLTLGIFSGVANVIGLYILTLLQPQFHILPYSLKGFNINGFVIPPTDLNIIEVAVIAAFLIGIITNFLKWLAR